MLTKPWLLYVFRHSSLTEKSQILSESLLKEHAGWTMSSNMPQIYVHLKGESSKILLQTRGFFKREDSEISQALLSKQCPNCCEPNKPDSRFCTKCKMILTFDAYSKIQKDQKEKDDRLNNIEKQMNAIFAIISKLDQSSKNSISKDLFRKGVIELDSS